MQHVTVADNLEIAWKPSPSAAQLIAIKAPQTSAMGILRHARSAREDDRNLEPSGESDQAAANSPSFIGPGPNSFQPAFAGTSHQSDCRQKTALKKQRWLWAAARKALRLKGNSRRFATVWHAFAKVPASLNFSAAVMGSGTTVNTLFLRNSRFEEKLMQLMREQLPWQRNVGKCHCRP